MRIDDEYDPRSDGAGIPAWLLRRRNFSPGAKLCYGLLVRHVGQVAPALPVLAEALGVSERQVTGYLSLLKAAGLIEPRRHGRGGTEYVLLAHSWMRETSQHPATFSPETSQHSSSVQTRDTASAYPGTPETSQHPATFRPSETLATPAPVPPCTPLVPPPPESETANAVVRGGTPAAAAAWQIGDTRVELYEPPTRETVPLPEPPPPRSETPLARAAQLLRTCQRVVYPFLGAEVTGKAADEFCSQVATHLEMGALVDAATIQAAVDRASREYREHREQGNTGPRTVGWVLNALRDVLLERREREQTAASPPPVKKRPIWQTAQSWDEIPNAGKDLPASQFFPTVHRLGQPPWVVTPRAEQRH